MLYETNKKSINALILRVRLNILVTVSSLDELRGFRVLQLNDKRLFRLLILIYLHRLSVAGMLILIFTSDLPPLVPFLQPRFCAGHWFLPRPSQSKNILLHAFHSFEARSVFSSLPATPFPTS